MGLTATALAHVPRCNDDGDEQEVQMTIHPVTNEVPSFLSPCFVAHCTLGNCSLALRLVRGKLLSSLAIEDD